MREHFAYHYIYTRLFSLDTERESNFIERFRHLELSEEFVLWSFGRIWRFTHASYAIYRDRHTYPSIYTCLFFLQYTNILMYSTFRNVP